jgi:hypothetical protein
MKSNRVIYPFLLLCFYISSCSPKLAPQGHYQDTPVTADGKTDDWHLPLRFSNDKYTYQYNVTNDDKNIYICILSTDNATQKRIMKNGMTIFFDRKGKKNKDVSLSFPIPKDDDDDNFNRYRAQNGYPVTPADRDSTKAKMLKESDVFNTKGFINMENGQFGTNDPKNTIHVALQLNNNDSVLVYEAVIPFNIITGSDLTPKQAARNFSVGIELNAVPNQGGGGGGGGNRPSMGGMRMGMGMGGMGMGMGGMRGGGGRNGNSQRTQGAKEEDTWYPFRPAKKS